jgi:hypothetical protein
MLPRRKPGRQSKAAQEKYQNDLDDFIQLLIGIDAVVDFKMSARGWCYILEEYGLTKDDFDYAEGLINDLRRDGSLPNGFMANEPARSFSCIERDIDDTTPEEEADYILKQMFAGHEDYYPESFWDDQECYIQMLVEKVDLKTLFESICEEYNIPIATSKGWSSIGQRKELIFRYKEYEQQGKVPVLLYCGDFDPAGLNISKFLRSNIDSLSGATDWKSTNLMVSRFGLNYNFITENNLTWIDNLITGNKTGINDLADPRHTDHNKRYVQEYLHRYCTKDKDGKWQGRKCEANAIVKVPKMGRQLCQDAISQYITPDSIDRHKEKIEPQQMEVKDWVRRFIGNIRDMSPREYKTYIESFD